MKNPVYIIGISAYYHDSAVAILCDGEIIAAAQEERFTRKKHDSSFPRNALNYCLREANISLGQVSYVTFYDKPILKFERLLETYLSFAPKGFSSFVASMPVWVKEKLFLKSGLKRELSTFLEDKSSKIPKILFTTHHQSHASSAFFASPYQKASVLCLDGVGEWATTSAWKGDGNKLQLDWEINFPHSLGLLYSAFTYYTGFKVNSGEYKLMGLAPYGEPKYYQKILDHIIDVKDDGTFRLDMSYFDFATGLRMTNRKFDQLFGGPARKPESKITQREMDLAASVQKVTEAILLKIIKTVKKEHQSDYLCLAGGVALNCVANGLMKKEKLFKDIWVQPAAGDAGGALGAALSTWYEFLKKDRCTEKLENSDYMKGSLLGPSFSDDEILKAISDQNLKFEYFKDDKSLYARVTKALSEEKVVGWFQGRMEYGPRALGARSIIGDPRSKKMQRTMNLKIKYRESFRPFAPSVLEEKVSDFFDYEGESPYMLMVAPVSDAIKIESSKDEQSDLFGIDKLNVQRSQLPAITHVDYSARIQTVSSSRNKKYYELIKSFDENYECPVVVNTSFNVRGEPIVCTPEDAIRCFLRSEMDLLVLENFVLDKNENKDKCGQDESWRNEFVLD